jgi:hypothetical protein
VLARAVIRGRIFKTTGDRVLLEFPPSWLRSSARLQQVADEVIE